MTHEEAKQAIDRAFEDSISNLFEILIQNLERKELQAEDKFYSGFEFHLRAHEIAMAIADELTGEK